MMFVVGDEEAVIGEDARVLCMGGEVRTGNGVVSCGLSLLVARQ